MHYSNGRAAKVGDLVRGRGYNVKYEITGMLIHASPEVTACNCQVAHVGPSSTIWYATSGMDRAQFVHAVVSGWTLTNRVEASVEYGQLDAFVAIDPATGEVLPPATAPEVEAQQ